MVMHLILLREISSSQGKLCQPCGAATAIAGLHMCSSAIYAAPTVSV